MTKSISIDTVNSNITLSIITVVKNDPLRLLTTINSLRGCYGNNRIEHIIIDGESSSETLNIIDDVKAHANVKILSEHDRGIYDGMNKGVSLASGKYLLFLNCGDRMLLDGSQVLSFLNNAPVVDILCFPCQLSEGNAVIQLLPIVGVKHKTPTSHQAMIFLKSFFDGHSYDLRYRIAADYDLYLCADDDRVHSLINCLPLTSIQNTGFASENPMLAYREYCLIALRRLKGCVRFLVLCRIFFRASLVLGLKKILPKKFVSSIGMFFR